VLHESEIKLVSHPANEKLDAFALKQPEGNIFQTSYMAEVFKNAKRCDSLKLGVVNENDEIIASMVAIELIAVSNFLKFFTTHSTVMGGPIFTTDRESLKGLSLLIKYYDKMEKKKSIYSRIYPFNGQFISKHIIEENGYVREDWFNYLIDLTKTKEELFIGLKRDKRRAIKKAKENGVRIEEGGDRSHIQIFYEMLQQTYKDAGLPVDDITLFESVLELFVPNNMARYVLAKYNGEYIAGRLILTYKKQIYDWYACASKEYLQLYPNDFLIWDILKWGSENGYHTFDFGGAGNTNERVGIQRFKNRFGGKMVNYGRYTKVHKPKRLWFAEKLYRKKINE
jgi:serine/alanine adding enzyme